MLKKVLFLSLVGVLMAAFLFQTAMAADPNWQAKQKKLLEQTGLKPGDVIDASNWQKVQNLLPESIASYVKKGEFVLKIGEFKYDYANDEAWDKAGLANKGKYALGSGKEVIDKATGKYPMYLYGRPFPDLDKNDPDFGIKLMHHRTADEARTGNSAESSTTNFVSEKGLDRQLWNFVLYNHFWSPMGERPNPNKFKFMSIVQLNEPYDLAGTIILTHRPLDGSSDRGGTYVPALRRVRKTSGTNRSDPFFGSDFVMDDASGWGGQNESMSWRVIGEKVVLIPKADWQAERPDVYAKEPNGAWKSPRNIPAIKFGVADKTLKGAPWAPINVVWVPRDMYLIEATPLDPYYNYGKQVFYLDKDTGTVAYKIISNKAGEHWKTLMVDMYAEVWGKNRAVIISGWYIIIDDKRHHACTCHAVGGLAGSPRYYTDVVIADPTMNDSDFTFERIATRSK